MAEERREVVTLRRRLVVVGGAQFNPGERVALDPTLARDLIAQGDADADPVEAALDRPPRDRMIRPGQTTRK